MRPCKNFTFVLPFEKYRELRKLSIDSDKPIAELIRQGIDFVLRGKGTVRNASDC